MLSNPYAGKFITFEGIDGSGKSEQFRRALTVMGAYHPEIKFFETKEPTKEASGVKIYDILFGRHPLFKLESMRPFDMQELYFEDRIVHYKNIVIPKLMDGIHVISDRGAASKVYGVNHPSDFVTLSKLEEDMFKQADVPYIWPDAILIYDVPVSVAMERLKAKNVELDKFEQEQNLIRVKQNYLDFANQFTNCHIIDGNADPTAVFVETRRILGKIFGVSEWNK